ncbi:hypothetical protein ACN47E_002042 [Coniothyrium glycines]
MGLGGLDGSIGEEMGMWEVKVTSEKGKGLFAKNDIATIFAGESVVLQTPVLLIAKSLLETPSLPQKQRVLDVAVKQLPETTRTSVLSLHHSRSSNPVEKIAVSNSVTVNWPWIDHVPQLLAIVPEAARINHACRPNASWRFNDYTLAVEVFALKHIKPGEEITISYGFETRSFKRRVRSIEENLGFRCLCRLCTSDEDAVDASNERLSEIKALKSVLPTDPKDSPQLIALLPKLISQMEEEDLIIERPIYWAGRARRHWAVIAGKESWEQRRCGELEENVSGHSTWMTWEGDPFEGIGQGHPWEEKEDENQDHEHDHTRARG